MTDAPHSGSRDKEALIATRELLSDRERWGRTHYCTASDDGSVVDLKMFSQIEDPAEYCFCVYGALAFVQKENPDNHLPGSEHLETAALELFRYSPLSVNDKDTFGYECVLQMLDRAIELADAA